MAIAKTRVSRGVPISRRDTQVLSDGAYSFRDQLHVEDTLTATIITCTGWLLEYFEIEAGELCFISGDVTVRPRGKSWWVFYPPFSLSRPSFHGFLGTVTGKAGTDAVPQRFRDSPFIFYSDRSIADDSIADILVSALSRQPIDLNPRASVLSSRAKKLIADAHPADPSIAAVAARLGVSNAHLSRQFKRDYGMSPRQYLHQLRIADVPLRLARGESIAEVSRRGGYGDLSRFYKQFRKATRTSPGRCRTMVAPRRG